MTDNNRPKPATTPLPWILLAVAVAMTVYALFAAGGLATRMNTTSSAVPTRHLPTVPIGALCPVSETLTLESRVDVRIQAAQGEGLMIARRTTADVDEDGLHLPAGTPFGTGTISLGAADYATFEFGAQGCTTVIPRPPEPDATAPQDSQ